jgi:GT2 family glycosyltransferase
VVIGLVILTYEGLEYVDDLACSIRAQRYPYLRVVFVDNGSRDGTPSRVRELLGPSATVLVNAENRGCAAGYNQGAAVLRDVDILAFLNQDVVLDPDYCSVIAGRMRVDARITALQPWVRFLHDPARTENCGHTVDSWLTTETVFHRQTVPLGEVPIGLMFTLTAPAVRRESFERLGGFDEALFVYYEDTDLSLRIWEMGGTVAFEPAAIVYHAQEGSAHHFADSWRRWLWTRNRLRLLWKHAQGPSEIGRAIVASAGAVALATSLLPRRKSEARAVAKGVWSLLGQWREIGTARRIAIQSRQMSLRDLTEAGVVRKPPGALSTIRRAWASRG